MPRGGGATAVVVVAVSHGCVFLVALEFLFCLLCSLIVLSFGLGVGVVSVLGWLCVLVSALALVSVTPVAVP